MFDFSAVAFRPLVIVKITIPNKAAAIIKAKRVLGAFAIHSFISDSLLVSIIAKSKTIVMPTP